MTAADQDELLATAEESLGQLSRLAATRQTSAAGRGTVGIPRPADLEEIITCSSTGLGLSGRTVRVDVPPGLPKVVADPPVMERVIANLTANALRYSPAGAPPLVTARARSGRIELRVIDCGPGVSEADRDRMFAPFQRLGDTDSTTGVGLGLAVSRGLTEAMRGTLRPARDPWRRPDDDDVTARGTQADPGPSAGLQVSRDWTVRRVTGSSRDRDHPWELPDRALWRRSPRVHKSGIGRWTQMNKTRRRRSRGRQPRGGWCDRHLQRLSAPCPATISGCVP